MKKILILTQMLFVTFCCYSQIISFSDVQLKEYLVNENCIDIDYDGYADTNADFNNDNEIQMSEVESILNLRISDLGDNYAIKSIQDLSNFHNLKQLRLHHNDSLLQISNLGLVNLDTFRISVSPSLKIIDISDLTALTDLRIEDLDTLDYLNIQNGSVADYFSLFYTQHILDACVDDIAEEYDVVAMHMNAGTPSIECSIINNNREIEEDKYIKISPNPAQDIIRIDASILVDKISVFNAEGKLVRKLQSDNNKFDISFLIPGVYFIGVQIGDQVLFEKVYKK